ncbi:MAG: polysaccharide deacetylase family protein [Firmicutes bacterium]|nr:polysaccharide deacetylase family protein [Bacillota bacterium]
MKKALGWTLAAILILSVVCFAGLKAANSRTFMFFGAPVARVDTSEKVIALTFDDGPGKKTDQVLEVLKASDVKATFFVIGANLEENPDEGRKLAAAGHQLGNHTYQHKRMVFKSPAYIRDEIERTDQLIRAAGYDGEILFRPPNCKKLLLLPYYLQRNGRQTITWDLEPDSYPEVAASSDRIVEYVKANARPGSIILLHVMSDSRAESLRAVPGIVSALRQDGYRFVTVSELLGYN